MTNNNKNTIKDAYSVTELLTLSIPDAPTTKQGMRWLLESKACPARQISCRGGKQLQYLVSGLPEDFRIALALKQTALIEQRLLPIAVTPAATQPLPETTKPTNLATWQIDIARARAAVVDQIDKLAEIVGPRAARSEFMHQFNAGAFDEASMEVFRSANARAGAKGRTLDEASVWRWQGMVKGKSLPGEIIAALAPRGRGKRYTPLADEALALALYRRPNKPALAWCVREALKQCPGATENALSKRVKRLIEKLPAPTFYPGRNSGAALKALQVFRRRETGKLLPNQVWVGDGHSMKMRVAHPETGKPFVPELTVVMDGADRSIVGWSISFSENVLTVADALRHGVSRNGAPLVYYSDNGAGQTAKMLDANLTGLLPSMGIEHRTGIAGNPQGRGMIERWWQTVAIPFAKRFATYRGHGADRDTLRRVSIEIDKQIREIQRADGVVTALPAKLPAFHTFMAELEQAIEEYNTTHRHRSLPKLDGINHATPAEYRTARVKEIEGGLVVPSMTETSLMFMPSVLRVAARGEVKLWNGIYYHADLMLADREQVQVHYDIHDASRVWVKRITGELLAVAELNGNRSGFFPQPYIDRLADQRAKGQVKLLEKKLAGVLEEHGAGALMAGPVPQAAPDTPEVAVEHARLVEEIRRPKVVALPVEQDEWAPIRRCRSLQQRIADGASVSDADRDWLAGYMQTADYRTFSMLAEEFPQKLAERMTS